MRERKGKGGGDDEKWEKKVGRERNANKVEYAGFRKMPRCF